MTINSEDKIKVKTLLSKYQSVIDNLDDTKVSKQDLYSLVNNAMRYVITNLYEDLKYASKHLWDDRYFYFLLFCQLFLLVI